ncbi:MAG: lysophospholipid acyltransferase family protein, partial [Myxococcota bacterium]|nr:lysophospholipid acyltransferase family protein [Myxococcota bacterium]
MGVFEPIRDVDHEVAQLARELVENREPSRFETSQAAGRRRGRAVRATRSRLPHPIHAANMAARMTPARNDDLSFEPAFVAELDRVMKPLKELMSPVAFGLEHVPRDGAVLLTGNHTIYGMLDIPMLGLEIYEATGRVVRGLGDHNHFALPVWRELLRRIGAVRGTRENCGRLFEAGEAVLVFPGGGREVMKHKGEKYRLVWKERVGFARLAIEHGVPIVPFASVGVEDMFEIVLDADDLLESPVGRLIRALGIMERPWFRRGEIIPPVAGGGGAGGGARAAPPRGGRAGRPPPPPPPPPPP